MRRLLKFERGKYSDGVRQCCLELLSMNVGWKMLSNIAGITVDQLQRYTTVVEMLPEMKALAYKQIAEQLQVSQQLTITVMAHQNLANTMDPFRYLPHNRCIHLDWVRCCVHRLSVPLTPWSLSYLRYRLQQEKGQEIQFWQTSRTQCPIDKLWRRALYLRASGVKFFHLLLRDEVMSHVMNKHESATSVTCTFL